jgi:hypothetical protein
VAELVSEAAHAARRRPGPRNLALRRLALLALLALAGCTSVPPTRVTTDRMDYGEVVAESWKRQTLLNVVRLRHADAPVFLEVGSIINSYTLGGTATAQAAIASRIEPNVFTLGGTGSWSNTPTVTYQPVFGDKFTKSMLHPIPPASIFQLLQGGWPATLVFRTVVGSVNGLRNSFAGVPADPGFIELIETLSRLQQGGDIGISVEPNKDKGAKNGGAVVAVIRRADPGTTLEADGRRVRELLGLDSGVFTFEISYGLVPRNRNEVALMSRSMMDILLQLGFGIDLPAASGARVLPDQGQAGGVKARPLVNIRSGTEGPADAYAAVPYKGHWYWIDDADVASKRIFTFLMILFSLAETGQPTATPVVTVPSR